jgi:CBS domain-containing protein
MSPAAGQVICGPLGATLSALVGRIDAADGVPALTRLAPEIRDVGVGFVEADAGPLVVTRVLTALNDRLGERVIAAVARLHRLPAAQWCWLAFGSEGRGEQTFATDQDNGLLFSAAGADEARAMRPLFEPFCRAVNAALDACGFPLCTGQIMAGNPAWCLSLDEWRARFVGWIRTPEPEALLNATIFFDFRPLCGEARLAKALRDHLLSLTSANEAFIRMMANNALGVAPPLGLLGEIAVEGDDAGVDLKKQGARLFVDAARIFALAAGVTEVGTVARLRAVGEAGKLLRGEAAAAEQAFAQIQRLRLDRQAEALRTGKPPGNRVRPTDLNEFEHRVLKESFRQARRLQQQLKTVFNLEA